MRYDRYFVIYYKSKGIRYEESVGWASEGWNAELAAERLHELKRNRRVGEGPRTLQESREQDDLRRKREAEEHARKERERVTFKDYFEHVYFPIAKTSKKQTTWATEAQHVRDWIGPVFGDKLLKDVDDLDVELVKAKMLSAGKAPRTVQYVFATIRQVWNHAARRKIVIGESPTKIVKIGRFDNRRLRYIKPDELDDLLEELEKRSHQAWAMAMIGIHTAARAGEIISLTWGAVDLEAKSITFLHTKTAQPRVIPMADPLVDVFKQLGPGKPDELVFLNKLGKQHQAIPGAFFAAVKATGLNDGVVDQRQKIVFHSLRHSAASYMLRNGVDPKTVMSICGWSTMQMLDRYSHVMSETKEHAIQGIGRTISNAGKNGKVVDIRRRAANDDEQ